MSDLGVKGEFPSCTDVVPSYPLSKSDIGGILDEWQNFDSRNRNGPVEGYERHRHQAVNVVRARVSRKTPNTPGRSRGR